MRKKRRLIWQLYPSYLLLILLSVSAISWYTTHSLHRFFINRIRGDLLAQGRLLENQVQAQLNPVNAAAMERLCQEVGKNAAIRVTVILPDGLVIGDSYEAPGKMENHAGRPEIREALEGAIGNSTRFSKTLHQNMMYVALPLTVGGRIQAVTRISLPLTAIEHEIRSLQGRLLLGGLIIAIIASGLCLFVSRRISRPIENMTSVAERFARGDLQYRLDVPDTAEFASLANALNQMAVQLQGRIETVINQRNEYEAVLASMAEGVIALDMDERILGVNAAAMKMLHLGSAKIKDRFIIEAIRNPDVYGFIIEALASGVSREGDVTLHSHGEQIMHIQCTPLRDAGDQRIGTLVVLNDVTRLRTLDMVRREFVANVSHEIKTPLTAIRGFVETLLQGPAESEEERHKFLQIIKKHAERLGAIIEDLLSLARLEQKDGVDTERFKPRELEELIETAVQLIKTKADEKHIGIEVEGGKGLRARVDGTLMEQAIVNLLDNAVKYSPEKSKVVVAVSLTGKDLSIRISDQGPGISNQHLPRLFERFYRVDRSRSRKLGGTGLGLAIVKHICQVHGGRVSVESELGRGSAFTIRLPKELIYQMA
jgi:two-component system, OmpR family, phosphate regulon sensor histidine kinase PhoR